MRSATERRAAISRRRVSMDFLPWSSDAAIHRQERLRLGGLRCCRKRSLPEPVSITRPRCSRTMSPASRRASPRSWVDITTLMPRAATARTTSSTALVAAGSRLAVGSSRNSTAGSRASARASASRCCSPPESRRAGRSAELSEAHQAEQFASCVARVRRAGCRRHAAHSGYWRRRCAGASSDAGTRWRAERRTCSTPAPGDAPVRRRDQPHRQCAAAWSCPSRSGRSARSARLART